MDPQEGFDRYLAHIVKRRLDDWFYRVVFGTEVRPRWWHLYDDDNALD